VAFTATNLDDALVTAAVPVLLVVLGVLVLVEAGTLSWL
jgi:hypothetical protein